MCVLCVMFEEALCVNETVSLNCAALRAHRRGCCFN